jgi:hypothetical protein
MNKITSFFLILLLVSIEAYAQEYVFGEGVQVGNSPLNVGGYISSVFKSNQKSDTYIDDIALLTYGEYDTFDFMAEFETADLYIKEFGGDSREESKASLHTERIYFDYYLDDNKRLRLGKFNSDIGFWNQTPINVFRDTTSGPHLARDFFPKLSTGLYYEIQPKDNYFDRLSLTFQNTHNLDCKYNNFNVERHYSVAADIVDQNKIWRFGGGYFRDIYFREAFYLLGAFKMEDKEWKLLFESIIREDAAERKVSYDIYVQGVWHVAEKHDVIFRSEVEKAPVTLQHDGIAVAGYTYRPLKNVALKGEFEAHQESSLNRLLFSLSVLF